MKNGPTLIYDKSALQRLTKDEAYWLHHHFHIVLTSTMFMEVMADLKKSVREGRTPETEVAIIADKMPNYAVTPTMFYKILVDLEFMYEPVEMGSQTHKNYRGCPR